MKNSSISFVLSLVWCFVFFAFDKTCLAGIRNTAFKIKVGNINGDSYCQNNQTKGIYNLRGVGGKRCCKEKHLKGPSSDIQVIKNATTSIITFGNIPQWVWCENNVTLNNGNDDLPTLLWKSQACIVSNYLGIPENDLNYNNYVQFKVANYTDENNVKTLIVDANTECEDGDKETEPYKRMEAYFWCFYKNERKVCHEPSDSVKNGLQLESLYEKVKLEKTKLINFTCPVPDDVSYGHCCKGKSIPINWRIQLVPLVEIPSEKLENGSTINSNSYTECIKSANAVWLQGHKAVTSSPDTKILIKKIMRIMIIVLMRVPWTQ